MIKGRRVFLDFRANPDGFRFEGLSEEARDYLTKSGALQATPLARLQAMNPGAIELYRDHGIDLARGAAGDRRLRPAQQRRAGRQPLVGVLNLQHLFPVGEVNGSHGVYRPGGSALNSGQVGGFRAAEYIARRYAAKTLDVEAFAGRRRPPPGPHCGGVRYAAPGVAGARSARSCSAG